MPFRKTYQINNREQGKAVQRDQSYRSCLITLLIFFFMCLIFILACIPWKMQNQKEYKDPHFKHEPQHHHQEGNQKETTIMTVLSTTQRTPMTEKTVLSRTWIPEAIITSITTEEITSEDTNVITEDYSKTNVKGNNNHQKETTIMTVLSTTQRTPMTERTVLSRTWIPEAVITSITTEEITSEDTNVITEDYSKTNVKGSYSKTNIKDSGYFERYFENVNEVTSPAPSQEDTEDYTMKKIRETVATTKQSLVTYDIVTDDVDNNAASTSPSGSAVSRSTTMKYATTIDTIKDAVITSKSAKESVSDSTNEYYSSDKSEVDSVTNNVITSTSSTRSSSNDLEEKISENPTKKDNTFSTSPSFLIDLEESTSAKYSSDKNYSEDSQFKVTTNDIIASTRSDLEENRDIENFTTTHLNYEKSAMAEYNSMLTINKTITRESSPSTINYSLVNENEFSTKIINEFEDIMNGTATSIKSYTTEKYNVTSSGLEKYNESYNYFNTTTSVFYHGTTVTIPMSYNETNRTERPAFLDTSVCETGDCKQIVSRMLSYMNHSADPCDDFYEYACGGFEANPQLVDGDLVRKSRNYQRIADQMLKEKRENVHSIFATYYDSCVQYERNTNFDERIRMASDALRKIGKFYIPTTWPDNYTGNFTNLFAQLILHHSALLFDVVPELDEYHPNSFTLKISPTIYESPFKAEYVEDPCLEDKFETKGQYVDLEILYNNYKRCKNDKNEFMRSIRKTLIELNVFKDLNGSYLGTEIEKTVHVIDSIVMQEYFSNFPPKNEIREAYLMNNYSKVNLVELQSNSAFINWAQLIRSLTGMHVITTETIQVYFYVALTNGLHNLEEYAKKDPMGLNNAIMALYAHKLYHELVLLKRDNVKDYCLHVATYLLKLEASSLYISSFTDHEIMQMNTMIEKTFNELKQMLSIKMQEAQWAKEEGREALLMKINNLKLTLPVDSYFKNRDSLYSEYNVSEIILHDNYFNNSMILLKRYRVLIYTELIRQVGDPKQIWTYYATPFQSKARAIYALNLIVIPYGIIDWSLINEFSFQYLLLATLGNLIAHQIAHHFDTNGIHYWNQTRNTQDSLMFENEFTNTNFDDYINCQKDNLYQEPIYMTLPFTHQTVSFRIPRLTLNERLSEIMGFRLAYDTLALRSSDAKRLPWIQLHVNQLFYLAYAQMYCTKMPLTLSYVSLHESEDLPSRIRVFVSASNNKFLAEAWNCPVGSQIAPNDVCSVFPYIETKEIMMIPV